MFSVRFLTASAAFILAGLVTPAAMAAQPSMEGHISIVPSEIKWADAPSVGPGAKIAVLEGDLKQNVPITFRLKLPPNFTIAPHIHPLFERVTVLAGTFYLGIGETFDKTKARAYPPGSVTMMPPGMPMYAYTTDEEVVAQIHGTGPWGITYLEAAAGKK
jgi:hypothetical protein